jgi:hypothetical protein
MPSTPPGPLARSSRWVAPDDGCAVFAGEDDGVGFSDNTVTRALEPFYTT